jgi:integrase
VSDICGCWRSIYSLFGRADTLVPGQKPKGQEEDHPHPELLLLDEACAYYLITDQDIHALVGDSNYREVPLTSNPRKALSEYLKHSQPHDLFWAGQRAQVEPFGPHACRHTCAARYLENNPGDLRGLASILGHSSLNTVMIYTEPTLADLAQRMENTL